MLIVCWVIRPIRHPFNVDYSTIVFDSNGELLRATLASDQQLRFPMGNMALSEKYLSCLKVYEDKRFGHHPGIDPIGILRAIKANIRGCPYMQGGSTLYMQLARMSAPRSRNIINKIREAAFALRLSVHFTPREILELYAAHVPMGGNTVGLHSASYRYFARSANELTWAQAALFAVLPNAPSDINLERRRPKLLAKRNRLLLRMAELKIIGRTTAELATLETLPAGIAPLPFDAPHACHHAIAAQPNNNTIHLELDKAIQHTVEGLTANHHQRLSRQNIQNVAVIVAETSTGKIRAYIGSQSFRDSLHQGQVDGVLARRSTGSLLKPYLAAKVLDRGPYTMTSRILDVPTFYGNFMPQNANKNHAGLVTLESMLIRSLNVPAARLLNRYGLEDFYEDLKLAGLHGLFRPAESYGLPLILGGAEASLFELLSIYLSLGNMGRKTLPRIMKNTSYQYEDIELFSPGAAWLVLNSLSNVIRPGAEAYWREFNGQIPVAWKTGTSYGQKDAWAIGVNAQWTIGVWAGNFTGMGNAALSGARSAGPLLFKIFNRLSNHDIPLWFDEPEAHLINIEVCTQSGYAAGPHCTETEIVKRPFVSWRAGCCPFHKYYIIDDSTGHSVCSLCWTTGRHHRERRFIVPASAREQLLARGRSVDAIPRHNALCLRAQDRDRFELIYPTPGLKIAIPRDYDGQYEQIVLSAKHQQQGMHCFWYLNHHFIAETVNRHEHSLHLNPGTYTLNVEDEEGFSKSVSFTIY